MADQDRSAMPQFYAASGDLELAILASHGDQLAISEVVRRTISPVRRSLIRMGAQPASAEDIAQDALMVALRKIDTYQGHGSLASWVIKISARLFIKQCQRDRRMLNQERVEGLTIDDRDTPTTDQRLDLDNALERLVPIERLCVSLCHGAGFSHREISNRLDIPLGTVKSHISRGLVKLRRYMAVDEE